MYLIKVLFILSRGACTETYRVAEIVDRIARHYRIKINYAHRLPCVFIKQDIVHFSVIMSHLKRKLACFMRVLKRIHIFFASDNEIYFILNAFGAAAYIIFHCFHKGFEPYGCVVKIGYCFIKRIRRKIRQHMLKPAECNSALIKILACFRKIK